MLQVTTLGVGVTMDNMLYIIAGLILILLVAVIVMRKKQAQKPPARRPMQTGRNASANAPISSTSRMYDINPAQRGASSANKFDNITIALRFMDQQRYDKAIETLNRGLIEKPDDNQLLLQLLSVYATINQPDDFYRTYDAIKAHSNAATIEQAEVLKTLLVEEHRQARPSGLTADSINSSRFERMEFDLPTAQTNIDSDDDKEVVFETTTAENNTSLETEMPSEHSELVDEKNEISAVNSNADDIFNLTLDDLETDDLEADDLEAKELEIETAEPEPANLTPVNQIDTADEQLITPANHDLDIIENTDDDDFSLDVDFDFDLPMQSPEPTPVNPVAANGHLEEISLDLDDDFVLDFAELAADVDTDVNVDVDADVENSTAADASVLVIEDDFVLSLESIDILDLETEDPSQINVSNIVEDNSMTSTTQPTVDNNPIIDDGFELDASPNNKIDSPRVTNPVKNASNTLVDANSTNDLKNHIQDVRGNVGNTIRDKGKDTVNAETAAALASHFAADFDFIKTLDSHQVTLDLAGQYLKLGEYDSAKRLLKEVMTQGNNEQQQQAQMLLDRTA